MFPDLLDLARRWEQHVEFGPVCWRWRAWCDPRWGYGRMHVGTHHRKRMFRAHRLAWLLHRGPIPAGLWVLHRCDNPPCVRPDHLFLGTHDDNMQDMAMKGRGRVSAGMLNPHRKLDTKHIAAIRAAYASGLYSQDALAKEFQIGQTHVSRIVRGEAWGEEG